MTKIKLTCDNIINDFILEDIYGCEYYIKNDEENLLERAWYLLRLPFNGQRIEIEKIEIDGFDIGQLIYTGYFETEPGIRHQPATAVWEPGEFKIWIHTSVGYWKGELITQIANGDFGKNLFDNYILTVDKPLELSEDFPTDIRSYFAHGTGPKWWHKSKSPYIELDIPEFETMLDEMHILEDYCEYSVPLSKKHKLWSYKSWDGAEIETADLTTYDAESYKGFGKYFQKIGYKKLFQVNFGYLGPMGYINMHKDDHTSSKNYKDIINNKKFYWSFKDAEYDYFKMSGVGIIPTKKPVLVDVCSYTHCVVNVSPSKTRRSLQVTGVF